MQISVRNAEGVSHAGIVSPEIMKAELGNTQALLKPVELAVELLGVIHERTTLLPEHLCELIVDIYGPLGTGSFGDWLDNPFTFIVQHLALCNAEHIAGKVFRNEGADLATPEAVAAKTESNLVFGSGRLRQYAAHLILSRCICFIPDFLRESRRNPHRRPVNAKDSGNKAVGVACGFCECEAE